MTLRKILAGLAKVLGLGLVLILTLAVFRLPVLPSLQLIYEGAFGDKFALGRTLSKATPMILTGLGTAVAWKAAAYNIGGEGQFIAGGLAGAALAKLLGYAVSGPWLAVPVLLAAMAGGALWAGLAGWLQVKRGVEPVISTILLNFVALQLMGWLIEGPLQEAAHRLPETDELPSAVMLFRPDRQMDLNLGTAIALLAAGLVYVYMQLTAAGFRLRVVGGNPMAARASGISASSVRLQAFLVSGLLCGLAGGVEYVGVAGLIGKGFNQNWGFLGIPVALLAGLNPLLVVLVALYFAALLAGSENLGRFTSGGPTLVYVVQAVAVLAFVAFGSVHLPKFRRAASTL